MPHSLHKFIFFSWKISAIIKEKNTNQRETAMNKKDTRIHAKQYMGNTYQMGGTRHYRLCDGISDGCRCIDVNTGSGFSYTVVCDRGLDISLASFQGTNLVFLTENMEAHPAHFDGADIQWLRTFSAGLLTTCGPTHLGPPCEDDGELLGQHGRWTSLPAKKVCDLSDYEAGILKITGELKDSTPFGHKIAIKRTISSEFGKSAVVIEDEVTNEGGKEVPLNLLYHINFGYPLLCEDTIVHVPSKECVGYDDYTNQRMDEKDTIKAPNGSNAEKNYMHTFSGEDATVWVHNPNLDGGLAVSITFPSEDLPYLTQWVLEDVKDYVLALEPANVPCESRDYLRKNNLLPFLAPGETKKFRVEINVIAGNDEIVKKLG